MRHLTPRPTTANGWTFARLEGMAQLRTKTFFTQPAGLISSPGHAFGKIGPEQSMLIANRSSSLTMKRRGQSESRSVQPQQHLPHAQARRCGSWRPVQKARFGKCLRIWSLYYPGTKKAPDLLWIRKRKITDLLALETQPGIFPSNL